MLVPGTAALKGCLFPLLLLERGVFFQYFFWKGVSFFNMSSGKGVFFNISAGKEYSFSRFYSGKGYISKDRNLKAILLQNVYFNAYGKGLFL